jgi:16S rRNA (adenine1518-N6/adenine1519-N6)-dimethyltransferase
VLLGPGEIRQIARRIGIAPSKRLGQNFVIDAGTVRRITALAALGPDDLVLEVGPGFGSLTLPLLASAGAVTAIEIDPVLAAELPATVAAHAPDLAGRLQVLTGDAARVRDLPGPGPTALVANLPYNAAVPVLLHLLATVPSIGRGLVMVQAEVADRMSAPPGSRTYGVPSVKLAWFAAVRRAGAVPRTVFWPVPRVDSGLVAFTRRDPPSVQDHAAAAGAAKGAAVAGGGATGGGVTGSARDAAAADGAMRGEAGAGGARTGLGPAPVSEPTRAEVFAVIDAAFAQRRKTLRAALAPWAGSAAAAGQILAAAGLDPGLRGEALGVTEFARIALAARTHGRPACGS